MRLRIILRCRHRLGLLAGAAFRGLFISPPPLHLAKGTLALHFLLQHPEGRVDVVVANKNLHRGPILSLFATRLRPRARSVSSGRGRRIRLSSGPPPTPQGDPAAWAGKRPDTTRCVRNPCRPCRGRDLAASRPVSAPAGRSPLPRS